VVPECDLKTNVMNTSARYRYIRTGKSRATEGTKEKLEGYSDSQAGSVMKY